MHRKPNAKHRLLPSRAISKLSLDLVMTLNVTTLESMQWENPANVAPVCWLFKTVWRAKQHSKKIHQKQASFNSARGKYTTWLCAYWQEKHKIRYRRCGKRHDSFGEWHRSVTAHFRFPCGVNTTPQMSCFRGAKVCTKCLQGKVMMNWYSLITRWEFGNEVENSQWQHQWLRGIARCVHHWTLPLTSTWA